MPKVSPICCSPAAFELLARQRPVIHSPDALLAGAVAIAGHQIRNLDLADVDRALQQDIVTADEEKQLKAVAEAVSAAVAVNDFAPDELTSRDGKSGGEKLFQAAAHRSAAE